MLVTQAVNAGATALPASPPCPPSTLMHSPGPGFRPLGGRDGSLWIWPELSTALVPLRHVGALMRRKGLLPIPGHYPECQDPQTPNSPAGCLSGCTSPPSSQLQPEFSDGEAEAQRGEGPVCSCFAREALLGPDPPARASSCTAPPPTAHSIPAGSCSWNCPGN